MNKNAYFDKKYTQKLPFTRDCTFCLKLFNGWKQNVYAILKKMAADVFTPMNKYSKLIFWPSIKTNKISSLGPQKHSFNKALYGFQYFSEQLSSMLLKVLSGLLKTSNKEPDTSKQCKMSHIEDIPIFSLSLHFKREEL